MISRTTGARKPGPRGDRDISRKPLRRECRLIWLNLWRLPPAFFYCRWAVGEVITRHSLRPLRFPRAKVFAALGRERVAGSRRYAHPKVGQF